MANLKVEVLAKLVTLKRDFDADRVFAHAALKEAEQRQMVDPLLLAWADTLDEVARLKRLLFGEQNRYSAESAKVHVAEKHIDELSKINEFMAEGLRQKDERIISLENQLRRQDEALKRAGSAARFAIDPARAQDLKAMIGKPGVFADNGDELEKQYQEEADALGRVRALATAAKNVLNLVEDGIDCFETCLDGELGSFIGRAVHPESEELLGLIKALTDWEGGE